MGILRLLLALSVLIDHSGPLFGLHFVGGEIAVQCFFAISGFYMAFILNEKYIGENASWKLFISNRLLRLMPLYWIVVALIIFKSAFLYVITNKETASHLQPYVEYGSDLNLFSWITIFFTNLFILGQDFLMFMAINLNSGSLYFTSNFASSTPPVHSFLLIPPAWSISLELLFYAVAPFLLRKKISVLIAFLAASIVLRVFLYSSGFNFDPWTYRFFSTELALFIAGALGYRFYELHLKSSPAHPFISKYFFLGIIFCILFYSKISFEYQRLLFTMLFILAIPYIFSFSKNIKIDREIGELSYPIYLVHMFIGSMILYLPFTALLGKGLCLSLLSILFAWLFNSLLGKRLEKIRQKRVS